LSTVYHQGTRKNHAHLRPPRHTKAADSSAAFRLWHHSYHLH